MQIGLIILAAGDSSRLGESKQLLIVDNGKPLLLYMAEIALAANVQTVMVVLGANIEMHKSAIKHLAVTIANNTDWKKGVGTSIKKGIEKLLQVDPTTDGATIMVCDQPSLDAEHLNRMITKFSKNRECIIASSYSNITGTPVLFPKSTFKNLLLLDGDQGAKTVIKENHDIVIPISFPGGEFDIDTPADYSNFKQKSHSS